MVVHAFHAATHGSNFGNYDFGLRRTRTIQKFLFLRYFVHCAGGGDSVNAPLSMVTAGGDEMQVHGDLPLGCVEEGDVASPKIPPPEPFCTHSCLPITEPLQCTQDMQPQGLLVGHSPKHSLDDEQRRHSSESGSFHSEQLTCGGHSMISQLPSPRASDRATLSAD